MQFLNFQLNSDTRRPDTRRRCHQIVAPVCAEHKPSLDVRRQQRSMGSAASVVCWRWRPLLAMLTATWRPRARHHQRPRSCFVRGGTGPGHIGGCGGDYNVMLTCIAPWTKWVKNRGSLETGTTRYARVYNTRLHTYIMVTLYLDNNATHSYL